MKKVLLAFALSLVASVALAQTGFVSDHAIPIGKGPGVTGFGEAAPGASGRVLTSNGPSLDPTFQTVPLPTPQVIGAYGSGYTNVAAGAINPAGLVGKVLQDTGVNQSNTLPAASSIPGYTLQFNHAQSGTWTISRAGSDNIFGPNNLWGVTAITLTNLGDFVALLSDGGNWHVIAGSTAVSGGFATASQYIAGNNPSASIPPSVIYQAEVPVAFSATPTFDFSTFINASITLTGNITTMNLSNVTAGKAGTITFVQDGTGNRTTVWNSILKFSGGTTPTLSTVAGRIDVLSYSCRSATFCVASLLNDVR